MYWLSILIWEAPSLNAACTVFPRVAPDTRQTLYVPLATFQTLSSMQIQNFNVGMLSTNCYVVNCPETKEAIIIDPGFEATHEAEQVIRFVEENELKVKFIVNTHGAAHDNHTAVIPDRLRHGILVVNGDELAINI